MVDLYQVHYPWRWMSIPKLMNLMADAVEAGRVRAVGVSNYAAEQLSTAHDALARRGIPLASEQVQYSLLHRAPEVNGVLDVCRCLGITLIAYMPLASGALTGKYSAENRPGRLAQVLTHVPRQGLSRLEQVGSVLRDIASRHDREPSQVALRWLIQQPGVSPARGRRPAARPRSFELDDEDGARLDKATFQR